MPVKLEISCAENSNLVIFPGVGAIDLRKWTYDEAFEKVQMTEGLPGGGGGGGGC